ncbi:hypothetical protein GJAV_G00086850 [Gymnothorax javanicus]|nr:hypothetical protein GJAV_G00086850 [Gymnothorax javanicus]
MLTDPSITLSAFDSYSADLTFCACAYRSCNRILPEVTSPLVTQQVKKLSCYPRKHPNEHGSCTSEHI